MRTDQFVLMTQYSGEQADMVECFCSRRLKFSRFLRCFTPLTSVMELLSAKICRRDGLSLSEWWMAEKISHTVRRFGMSARSSLESELFDTFNMRSSVAGA